MAVNAQARELSNLRREQAGVDEENARLNSVMPFGGRGPLGAPKSQFLGQQSYTNNLNRQSQIANLSSQLAGKGPANVIAHYPGGGGAMPSSMNALRSAVSPSADAANAWNLAQPDPIEREYNYERLRQARLGNEAQGEQLWQVSKADSPYYREKEGDINRAEAERNATSQGTAAVNKYVAEDPMRRDVQFEQDRQARDRGYYDPAVEAARVKGEADIARAGADKSREQSAALKALTDLLKAQSAVQPEIETGTGETIPGTGYGPMDWWAKPKMKPNPAYEGLQAGVEDARRVLGMQTGQGGGGAAGGKQMSMEDLSAFADSKGMTLDEAQKLAEQHGYAIR
jgi:hypothetical protein